MEPIFVNPIIGADIEVFLMRESDHVIVSAEPYIKGSKYDPFFFDKDDKFAATSLDNILSEFSIAPAKECSAFVANINKSMGYIKSILPEGLCIAAIPSAIVDPEFLQTDQAKLFGCESDYNVWKKEPNQKPQAQNQNLRSAGFHVHLGYDNPELEKSELGVKAMDLFLGVPSILIEPDNERRQLYGKAGAFRMKGYGFEYRSLSGFFASSDELKSWVYQNAVSSVDFVNKNGIEPIEAVGDQIQAAINSNDKTLAGNLIRQFEIEMP